MNNIHIVYDSYIVIANLDALISGVDFHRDLIKLFGVPYQRNDRWERLLLADSTQ